MIFVKARSDSIFEKLNEDMNDYHKNKELAYKYEQESIRDMASAYEIVNSNKKLIARRLKKEKQYLENIGLWEKVEVVLDVFKNGNIDKPEHMEIIWHTLNEIKTKNDNNKKTDENNKASDDDLDNNY